MKLQGVPKDLPPTFSHLFQNVLPDASRNWLDGLPATRLRDCLERQQINKPLIPLSKAELEADFTFFTEIQPPIVSAPVAAPAAAVPATKLSVFPVASSSESAPILKVEAGQPPVSTSGATAPVPKPTLKLRMGAGAASSSAAAPIGAGAGIPDVIMAAPLQPSPALDFIRYPELTPAASAALTREDNLFEHLASSALDDAAKERLTARFNQEVCLNGWKKLRALKFEGWPDKPEWNDGNPFVFKITKSSEDGLGVTGYCDVIKRPMDLTRIREKIDAKKYVSPHMFLDDVSMIAYNAKFYNGPDYARESQAFPDPSELEASAFGPGQVYFMAFEFEKVAKTLESPVRTCYEQLERLCKRAVVTKLLQSGGLAAMVRAQNSWYLNDRGYQEQLTAATKEWAEKHGINLWR